MAAVAAAQFGQVNYYIGGDCTDSADSVQLGWAIDGICQDYYIANTWSANIGNSYYGEIQCYFFIEAGCNGDGYSAMYGGTDANCAQNYGDGFQSFNCYTL